MDSENGSIAISAEVSRTVTPIIAGMVERSGYQISLDGLIRSWKELVSLVEVGYDESIYEYINDLSTRDLIQEILTGVPMAVRGKVEGIVHPLDARFVAATREITRPISAGGVEPPGPWRHRIPKKLSQQLGRDLQTEGLLE